MTQDRLNLMNLAHWVYGNAEVNLEPCKTSQQIADQPHVVNVNPEDVFELPTRPAPGYFSPAYVVGVDPYGNLAPTRCSIFKILDDGSIERCQQPE